VDALVAGGIEIGAITDYNGIRTEWFTPLRDLARARGMTLLPGVEVSLECPKHGLHVLAIFHAGEDLLKVNAFLQGLDVDPAGPLVGSDGQHRRIKPTKTPLEALLRLRNRFGCLLIPCHPDGGNGGFMKSMDATGAADFLQDLEPDAIDHMDTEQVKRLSSIAIPFPGLKSVARVEFSDAHSIDEIGTKRDPSGGLRATNLRLSATDIEALRFALHDPETRVLVGRVPPAKHARIRRMEISSGHFLDRMVINWNDDLNVIIGGRGVGKSAIIETLRYALDIAPLADGDYREALVGHALGSGGRVEVVLERPMGSGPSPLYRVTRVRGEKPHVVEIDTGKELDLPPAGLWGPGAAPVILGQREIYVLSGSEQHRLALLDELIGEDARARGFAMREAVEGLRASAKAIMDTEARLSRGEDYRQRLRSIEHEIAVCEKHGAAVKLREASRLRSDGQLLRDACETTRSSGAEWGAVSEGVLTPLDTALRGLDRGQSPQKVILDDASQTVRDLRSGLERLIGEGVSLFAKAESSLADEQRRWAQAIKPLEEEINRIKRETQTETLDPDRLLRLTEERTALIPLIEDLERQEARLEDLRQKRRSLIAEARDRRSEEHQLRKDRARAISDRLDGRLQLEVTYKGQRDDYKKRLESLFKGSLLSQEALDCLAVPEATDGPALAEAVRAGTKEVRDKFHLTEAMADRAVKWFRSDTSRLHELETIIPGDALKVALRVDDGYRSLEHLSAGQRATAILLLLFALEGQVLVLDQPEDDLDNRFVYEDIVQLLRRQKGLGVSPQRRQIIAVTHNPNIPVIGDAELVIALEVEDNKASVRARASTDDSAVRETIKEIMEGGKDAFRRRAEKYGGVWT
jgi:DNA repair ATPase RecN